MADVTTREGPRGVVALWFGALAAPLAWFAMLYVNYGLEEVIACSPGAGPTGEIWSLPLRSFVLLVNGGLFAVAVAALLVSVIWYRRLRDTDDSVGGVARWLALAGIIDSVVFGLVLAGGFVPPLILETCQVTP